MIISRTTGAMWMRLLCVLAVVLILSGCGSSDTPVETEDISVETTSAVLPLAEEDSAQVVPTDVQILPDTTEEAMEAADQETMETVGATISEEAAEPEVLDATVPEEESVPKETQVSQELIAAQEENRMLQEKLEEMSGNQEKQKMTQIVIGALATVILVMALIFLYLWRKADHALKKARRRNQHLDAPISQIHVGKTHGIGGRNSQQDSFSVSPTELYEQNGVLAVVADGMGGLENGDKASQAAVISAMESFYQVTGTGTERLLQILTVAKSAVNAVRTGLGTSECGTTLLMGLIQNGEFHYVSVGDSRIYLYRAGRLVQLNREHSYLYDQLHQAVNGKIGIREAFANEKNGCITSYLGMQEMTHVDIPANAISILPRDKFLLMSDGVYNALTEEEICIAMRHPAQDAAEAIKSFISTKNFQDQDNYTLVVLECR